MSWLGTSFETKSMTRRSVYFGSIARPPPVYLHEQTSSGPTSMSQKCQKRTGVTWCLRPQPICLLIVAIAPF